MSRAAFLFAALLAAPLHAAPLTGTFPSIDGGTLSIEDWRGRPVLGLAELLAVGSVLVLVEGWKSVRLRLLPLLFQLPVPYSQREWFVQVPVQVRRLRPCH